MDDPITNLNSCDFDSWTCYFSDKVTINNSTVIVLMLVMENPKKKESPKDDSLDLGLRARVAFAATADEAEESETSSNYEEGLTNEGLHKYVHQTIDELKKTKASSHVRKSKTHQTS